MVLWYNKVTRICEVFVLSVLYSRRPPPWQQRVNGRRVALNTCEGILDRHPPLEKCPALILNADYRPLSYFPLSIWPWQEAVKAIFRDSVTVISEYERTVCSPTREFKLPSVLALKEYVPMGRSPAFTRFNVFLRDQWVCQYCTHDFKTHELTFDHVVPRSRGGRTTWENIVAACQACNTRKGNHLPREVNMFPFKEPQQPTLHELQGQGRKFPPNFLHESWGDFLYWDTELDDG